MSNTKWLRRALLGGVALSVMATGAQADELSALKAQLEALQSRVNTLEAQPAPAALPEGYALMTFERGEGGNADWANVSKKDSINYAEGRGFTIAVTPTADLPAPVAEVTVYGYIKGDVIYDFDEDGSNTSMWLPSITTFSPMDDHIALTAAQSRFGIRSRVDTAVGQIRTQLEMDFETGAGGNGPGTSGSIRLRLRHAVGHWDFAPGWTFSAGQYWNIGALLPIGVTTVDWGAYAGPTYGRDAQVRLGYADGPISFAVAIENPTFVSRTAGPNVGAYFQYDIAGGHQLALSGEVADWACGPACFGQDDLGWVVGGGVNINLADIATLTTGAHYGEGLVLKYISQERFQTTNVAGDPLEAWGIMAGINFAINDATSVNLAWGYSEALDTQANLAIGTQDEAMTIHANILWQPVRQMRLGWEVHYGEASYQNIGSRDTAGVQFGAWFFF